MWIADGWKDYEVIDCSDGAGANIPCSGRIRRFCGALLRKIRHGINSTVTITEATRVAENGNSSVCQSSGP